MTWYKSPRPKGIIVLAHGAGAGQTHPWMVQRAQAWAVRGFDVATFDFLYMANKRKLPDRPAVLIDTWRKAIAEAGGSVIAAGKSMGGRIATMTAAEGHSGITKLVTLGYPLHPPGQPQKLRIEHLPRITVPWLAVQGDRDTFGSPAELQPHLPPHAELYAVAKADHSLKRGHDDNINDVIVQWLMR